MSQQQPHQNRGSFNNSASTNRTVSSSSHNYNNNRQDGRSLAKTTTTSRTSKSGNNTSPIAVVNTNFQMPLSNGPTILEKNHLYQQQQQQQLQQHEQFGNHVVNRQHYFQFIQQPQMSVQYSNTNVPFQNSANVQQHTNQQHTQQQQLQQHANIDNNVNNILLHNHNSSISSSGSVNENNMSPTTQSSSYFQSLPPEQFREMFLKKVFLGEDSSNFEVCKTTSSIGTAQTSPIAIDNNIQRVITNPSSPPQQNNNISPHALFPQPNVHNSPVTSPNSLLQMQQQNLLAPNHQHSLNQQQAMNVHNRNAIVNNELLPSLPPQQLENLSEQQLMEYILTWMTSVKTTNQ